MRKQSYSPQGTQPACDGLTLAELADQAENWCLDGEVRQLSEGTVYNRRLATDKLLWFLRQREAERCGLPELRAFFAYLNTAHEKPGGRWGSERRTKRLEPAAVKFYYSRLQTFFNFLVEEGAIERSPLERLKPPIVRQDQIQPFTDEQQKALLRAARRSRRSKRDEAIVLFLLDTGARASEVCGLRVKDLDLTGRRCKVRGKGDKDRTVCFSATTARALWAYLKEEPREPEAPLFLSERGEQAGGPLTRSGLLQLIERLGRAAGIEACRCSPHTFRHTFAVEFLRAGGNVFTLKELLGHTTLTMTNRYVALAQADLEAQHRRFSPVERLRLRGR